ncbi:MAG: hypothetical protein H0W58_13430 [Acidobacteria bacterium]|jgi:hypothetical protein|nr:hypothetical protein [Acidobacteriota bacterium]
MTSVVVWGIWCGGQYFNEAPVTPKRLSNPPDSVVASNAIPMDGDLPFFFLLNPLLGGKWSGANNQTVMIETVGDKYENS